MAIFTPQSIPASPILAATAAARINFEIPKPLDMPDGTIDEEALSQAVVTQYRNHYRLANDQAVDLQFSAVPYSVGLKDFIEAVADRLGIEQSAAIDILKAIIAELDDCYTGSLIQPITVEEQS